MLGLVLASSHGPGWPFSSAESKGVAAVVIGGDRFQDGFEARRVGLLGEREDGRDANENRGPASRVVAGGAKRATATDMTRYEEGRSSTSVPMCMLELAVQGSKWPSSLWS